jgi:hypothetical protein
MTMLNRNLLRGMENYLFKFVSKTRLTSSSGDCDWSDLGKFNCKYMELGLFRILMGVTSGQKNTLL